MPSLIKKSGRNGAVATAVPTQKILMAIAIAVILRLFCFPSERNSSRADSIRIIKFRHFGWRNGDGSSPRRRNFSFFAPKFLTMDVGKSFSIVSKFDESLSLSLPFFSCEFDN